jgi:hypothetical protein
LVTFVKKLSHFWRRRTKLGIIVDLEQNMNYCGQDATPKPLPHMWPFTRKAVVDADTAAWHVENFAWLVRQFGGATGLAHSKLVLSTPGFFVADGESGHALARRIFDQVKAYCGMSDWEADLVADDNPLADQGALSLATVAPQRHALGTFGVAGNRIMISYVPALLKRPDHLIATLAHELAHYLLATTRDRPPCEEDEREFLTDLAAVYLGFGVFLANARFRHESYQAGPLQGWRIGHSGYLPEPDLIFALALFIQTKAVDPNPALACLKPHLATMLRRTLRDLAKRAAMVAPIREAMSG